MIEFTMRLSCINHVGAFVKAADTLHCDITVRAGGYAVNGKSLMGILSLDITKPLTVEVHGTQAEADVLREAVQSYLAEA